MSDILLAEYTLKRALREHTTDLVATNNPHILCTPLPKHWRSNKSLPSQFRVISLGSVPDGTRVSLVAGNEERPCAELKNPVTLMQSNEARFSDLRFLGRSGRGKSFNITITMETSPPVVAVYARAIKVTVDGPRVPRNKYASLRAAKLHKESRRLGIRHLDHTGTVGRVIRGGKPSSGHVPTRTSTARRTLGNNNHKAFKMGLSTHPKEDKETKFSPQFQPFNCPTSMRQFTEPTDNCTPSVGYFSGSQSPIINHKGFPEFKLFSNYHDQKIPFTNPIESSLLLSSLNEAYIRLMQRQIHGANGLENRGKFRLSEKSPTTHSAHKHESENPFFTNACPLNSTGAHPQQQTASQFYKPDSNASISSLMSPCRTPAPDTSPHRTASASQLLPELCSGNAWFNRTSAMPSSTNLNLLGIPSVSTKAAFTGISTPNSHLSPKTSYTHQQYPNILQQQENTDGLHNDKTTSSPHPVYTYNNDPNLNHSFSSMLTAFLINRSLPLYSPTVSGYDQLLAEQLKQSTSWFDAGNSKHGSLLANDINASMHSWLRAFNRLTQGQSEKQHVTDWSKTALPPTPTEQKKTVGNILSVDSLLDCGADRSNSLPRAPLSAQMVMDRYSTEFGYPKTAANAAAELFLRKHVRQPFYGN